MCQRVAGESGSCNKVWNRSLPLCDHASNVRTFSYFVVGMEGTILWFESGACPRPSSSCGVDTVFSLIKYVNVYTSYQIQVGPRGGADLASNINAAWEEAEKAEAEEAAKRRSSRNNKSQRRSASPTGNRQMQAELKALDAEVLGEVQGSLMGNLLHMRVSDQTEEDIRNSIENVRGGVRTRQKERPRPQSAPRGGGRGRASVRQPTATPKVEVVIRDHPDGHAPHGHEPIIRPDAPKPSWMRGAPSSPPRHTVKRLPLIIR